MPKFHELAIKDPDGLRFGVSPKPLATRHGMLIGGGRVYPELNFTLPSMFVDKSTMSEIHRQYHEIIIGALTRAVELEADGLVIEFETLPPMTENPSWAVELAKILLDEMEEAHRKHGLKSVLRMTPNDTRGRWSVRRSCVMDIYGIACSKRLINPLRRERNY